MAENYDPILADMVAVARQAGALTLEHFKHFRDLEIGIKGPADFVSEADRQSEQLIRKYLFARYPDWSFTGEEFPPVDGADREHRWLVGRLVPSAIMPMSVLSLTSRRWPLRNAPCPLMAVNISSATGL